MQAFRYDALDGRGRKTTGIIDAANRREALVQLRNRGWHPLVITAAAQGSNRPATVLGAPSASARLAPRLQLQLLRQLGQMVSAGLPLERAISIVAKGEASPQVAIAARTIGEALRRGAPPSIAFAEGGAFDGAALAMIKSGESSGQLGAALLEIERLMTVQQQLKSKIRSALLYPAILTVVAILAVLMILLVVIPKFEPVIGPRLASLPLPAQMVFGLSSFVQSYGWLLGLAVGAFLLAAIQAARAGTLEPAVIRTLSRLPALSGLFRASQISRLCRSLGSLLSRNVLLMNALALAHQGEPGDAIGALLPKVQDRLRSGVSLSTALGETGTMPPLTLQLIVVGEETGDLPKMLIRAADLLDEEIDAATKRFLIVFEPVLLVGIGILVGGLLYGLFSAILSINEVVG